MKIKSGVYLKQAGWSSLALWENCGEEGYGGRNGSEIVARMFKQILASRCKLGVWQRVPVM